MKTRKMFLSMLAIAGMLFASSCNKEDMQTQTPDGDFVNATFTINTTDVVGTRAETIGDASTINRVACAVYDANGTEMEALREVVEFDQTTGKATYNVRLAKGQNYTAAFFAYTDNDTYDADDRVSPYYNATDLKSIKILHSNSNIEERDAFTGNIGISATELSTLGSVTKTVTLRRPFAQLNLGIDVDEYNDAQNAGIVVEKSKITVTNVWDAWSAFAGNIADDAQNGTMEFDLNTVPSVNLKADVDKNGTDEEYTYLALNYILPGDAQNTESLTNVTFNWKTNDGKTNTPATEFINIPVERNFRTNIVGKLLTSPTEFIININADFLKPDKNEIIETVVTKTVMDATELQNAINSAVVGRTTITFGDVITGHIVVNQRKDVEILIDGQGYQFQGTFFVKGGSNWVGKEALTLNNISFRNSADAITLGESGDTETRYVHNVVISNCKFHSIANENNNVAIRAYQANDITVINCEAAKQHSFAQITGGKHIEFDGIESNCTRGISLGTAIDCVVSNSEIIANGTEKYGIRHDAGATGGINTLKITNCTINAFIPVVVRNANSNPVTSYTLNFNGTNTLTKAGEYEVAIAQNEYDAIGKPLTLFASGIVTVTGANTNWVMQY